MASDNEACCESDPNFAVICGFFEKFGAICGLATIDFLDLQDMLENCQEVPQELIDLHVKLLRKARKSVSSERWERAVIKFCHTFCSQDAWEIERFGYKKARLSSKLRILKELLEMQFDYNPKFKNEVNKQSAQELRTQPLGRDRLGHVYWFQSDETCQIRVYKEDPDEETWALVVKNRDGLVNLITDLNDGKETVVNEDSNSLESEKPILDTGQTDSNSDSSKQDPVSVTDESQELNGKLEVPAAKPDEPKETETVPSEQEESQPKLSEATLTVSPAKSGINLRIKPMSELLTTAGVDGNKKEITGVKEKYIRSDSSSASFTHHRKAVDSAGFDVHANYLKRPLTEVEDVEVPSYIKRPRLDRPTLLGNKRKKSYSDEEEDEEDEEEGDEPELSDEIEEPLMLVKGEGSGQDNKTGNTPAVPPVIIEEEIEEDVMYFYGEGNGRECETGNDNEDKQQAKSEGINKSEDNQSSNSESDSVNNSQKNEIKLGTIIDIRTNKTLPHPNSPTKKSRWDMGKPSESQSTENHTAEPETAPSEASKVKDLVNKFENINKDEPAQPTTRSMFFFGPGCLTFKPALKTNPESSKDEPAPETCNNSKEPDSETPDELLGTSDSKTSAKVEDANHEEEKEKIIEGAPETTDKQQVDNSVREESTTSQSPTITDKAQTSAVALEHKPKNRLEDEKNKIKEKPHKTDSLNVATSIIENVSNITKSTNPTVVDIPAPLDSKLDTNNETCSSTLSNAQPQISNKSAILTAKPNESPVKEKELATSSDDSTKQIPPTEVALKTNEVHDVVVSAKKFDTNIHSLSGESSTGNKKEVLAISKETLIKAELKELKAPVKDDLNISSSGANLEVTASVAVDKPSVTTVEECKLPAKLSLKKEFAPEAVALESNISDLQKANDVSATQLMKAKKEIKVVKISNQNKSIDVPARATEVPTKAESSEIKAKEKSDKEVSLKTSTPLKQDNKDALKGKTTNLEAQDLSKIKSQMESFQERSLTKPKPSVSISEGVCSEAASKQTVEKKALVCISKVSETESSEAASKQAFEKEALVCPKVSESVISQATPKEYVKKEVSVCSSKVSESVSSEAAPKQIIEKENLVCPKVSESVSSKAASRQIIKKEVSVRPAEGFESVSSEIASKQIVTKEASVSSKVAESVSSKAAPKQIVEKEALVCLKVSELVSSEADPGQNVKKEVSERPAEITKSVSSEAASKRKVEKEVSESSIKLSDKELPKEVSPESQTAKGTKLDSSKETSGKNIERSGITNKSSKEASDATSALVKNKPILEGSSKEVSDVSKSIEKVFSKEVKAVAALVKSTSTSEGSSKELSDVSKSKEKVPIKEAFKLGPKNVSELVKNKPLSEGSSKEIIDVNKSKEEVPLKETSKLVPKKVAAIEENKSTAEGSSKEISDGNKSKEKVPLKEAPKLVPIKVTETDKPRIESSDESTSASKEDSKQSVETVLQKIPAPETVKPVSGTVTEKESRKEVKTKPSEKALQTSSIKSAQVTDNKETQPQSVKIPVVASVVEIKQRVKKSVEKPSDSIIAETISTSKIVPEKESEDSSNTNKSTVPLIVIEKSRVNQEEIIALTAGSKKTEKSKKPLPNASKKVLEESQHKADVKASAAAQSDKNEEHQPVTARRSTRRTRSTTFNKPQVENKNESDSKVVKKAKKATTKEATDKEAAPDVKIPTKPIETVPDAKISNKPSEKEESSEEEQVTVRELRKPKVVKKVVPVKKGKAANASKTSKPTEEVVEIKEKKPEELPRKTRSHVQKEAKSNEINLEDIEEQIVKNEIKQNKKPMEVDAPDTTKVDDGKKKKVKKGSNQEKSSDVEKMESEDKATSAVAVEVDAPDTTKVEDSKKKAKKGSNQEKSSDVEKIESEDKATPPLANEPKCVAKKVALLTCVDINTLKEPSDDEDKEDESDISDTGNDGGPEINDSDSESVVVISESDPLAEVEDSPPRLTLATFKLDADDSPISSPVRVTRKRAAQQSVDALRENIKKNKPQATEKKSGDDSKKAKLKQKRSVDHNLRRSIEEQKAKEISSSEEEQTQASVEKNKGSGKRRRSARATDSPNHSSDAVSENSKTDAATSKEKKSKKNTRLLLGLEISPEIENLLKDDAPIRQSRRIAQLKIKEEAERRKLEEDTLHDLKEEQRKRKGKKEYDKDYKSQEKRKRSKASPTDDETTNDANESDDKKKRKRKRKHWDPTKQFDAFKAWKSSSGSSSSEVEDEEEEIEEDEDHPVVLRSDHEFSPESDLEEGPDLQPLKRARTARKESDAEEEEVDDCSCLKCGQKDHPEWILLCDSCDAGWHCSCLRPALLVIPEGDWFCPPCQHATLVKKLEEQLNEYDKKMNKKEMEIRRKERLAYVGISLNNVLPSKEPEEQRHKPRHHHHHSDKDDDEDAVVEHGGENNSGESGTEDSQVSESESNSSSSSDNDEPVYQLRERRQAHSYRFNDYDELINSAIQEELDAVKEAGNQGRGKDISTIVNAEMEEGQAENDETKPAGEVPPDGAALENPLVAEPPVELEALPPVVPIEKDEDFDDGVIRPVRKIIGKKKHRKLNSLDISSEDDAESDEDFKGSSSSGSDDAEEDFSGSESSDLDNRRGKRRKDFGPIRRSTRARISRYDKDFINDSDSGEEAPSRKKSKSIWDESESEESDGSWRGRSKRKAKRSQRRKPVSSDKPKKPKKKRRLKRDGDDSDPEVFKRKPNIKFGGLNEEEDIGRRTRGKKINYLEALGTDSEDELRRKPPRIEESEEEYIVHEDEDFKHQIANEKDSDDSGPDPVLQDIAKLPHPKPKSRGRGKAGLKIPRKPKEPPPPDVFSAAAANMFNPQPNEVFSHQPTELFQTIPPDVYPPPPYQTGHPDMFSPAPDVYQATVPGGFPMGLGQQPPMMGPSTGLPPPNFLSRQLLENLDQESRNLDDEPNPIEQINKNVEQMNEEEMEKMMEEEDYANKQLQLVALQIEKEKKRREALRLEKVQGPVVPKTPKKRGRKPKNQSLESPNDSLFSSSLMMNSMAHNAELSEPPGLPLFSEIASLNVDGTPRKRRGRGKGKKTLAAEAAASSGKDGELDPGLDGSSNSNTASPASDSPMHSKLGIAAPPQPFSQSQPTPSVITRMLQSQTTPGAFPSKYFTGSPGDPASYHPGARGPIPGNYQQPPAGLPHYVRGGIPPGPPGLPPIYHRPMDPSPSAGGVSAANRDRNSPSIVSSASGSPLSKGEPTPPPPPYTRPQVGHFPPGAPSNTSAPRHVPMIPPPTHLQRGGTMSSPYHPNVPPNYHFGTYPPSLPPPIGSEEGQPPPPPPAGYPNAPFHEPFLADNGIPAQPSENNSGKGFEDDNGGEFVGLVSYFSSQREDDLDT